MQLPPPPPYEFDAITSHAPELISFEFFKKACYAWGHWQIAQGIPATELQNPETFVTEDDFERYQNVVSNWPRRAAMRPPSLPLMVSDLRALPGAPAMSFGQRLDQQYALIEAWMINNGVDPTRPNESKEERDKRLNRERVARHRQRNKMPTSDDPREIELVARLRDAANNVQAGKAWLRNRESTHKAVRDVALAEARATCANAIAADRAHVTEAEKALLDAQTALDQYRLNN